MRFRRLGESSVGGGITVVTIPYFGAELGDQLLFTGKSLNQKCVKSIIKIIIPPGAQHCTPTSWEGMAMKLGPDPKGA